MLKMRFDSDFKSVKVLQKGCSRPKVLLDLKKKKIQSEGIKLAKRFV